MCLGVPARVISIEGTTAIAEMGGVKYPVSLALMEDVSAGDYLLIHAGFAIGKVDPAEAAETLRLVREISATETSLDHGDETS
jgi:hydrogenase expression/formation protein HypC